MSDRIFEQSAGGIVYKKEQWRITILLLERTNSRGGIEYVLPKGHMENEETAKDTALREISEEAGLDPKFLKIVKFLTKVNYSFVASYKEGSPLIDKDVYLFLVQYTGTANPSVDLGDKTRESFSGFRWCTIEELKALDLKPDVATLVAKNRQFL